VVEVQKVWELVPDAQAPPTLDWPHNVDVELPAKDWPYRVEVLSGREVPIELILQPKLPELTTEPVQIESRWATRLKFGKPPAKDYVYLLLPRSQDAVRPPDAGQSRSAPRNCRRAGAQERQADGPLVRPTADARCGQDQDFAPGRPPRSQAGRKIQGMIWPRLRHGGPPGKSMGLSCFRSQFAALRGD
jgi:hypothetical protein